MTKYKFNQEAAKLGLPVTKIDKHGNILSADILILDDSITRVHTTNRIPYVPAKHPITLKVVKKDGEQVWPYEVYDVGISAVNYDGEFLYFNDPSLLSVEFDLEEITE